ncbi:ABC transporter permease [uncultured Pseudokineococcus sp.]|uniref:ABC transporter permease n=1 Tax=uncultured Pseudokineococcus sp. TaxID=1642928 RepID=UPI002602E88C|nr:ABC transporter permease [uncultured Pseudokineococcus sp.]
MFVAWRDLRFARGRFVLIGAVVALITLLVGFLAGLTGGLASQNVSAVLELPGDRLVLQQPADGRPSFSESTLQAGTVQMWRGAPGVDQVLPVGITQTRAEAGRTSTPVAAVGLPRSGGPGAVSDLAPSRDGSVGLSADAADQLGVGVGDQIGITGTTYQVAAVGGEAWYSHTPVITMTPDAWTAADERVGGDGAATVLAVSGDPDWDAVAETTGTAAKTPLAALTSLETFRSEVGSLGLMVAMLFGISALVVGAFFTVWTMQRARDVAVLKALGATTASLVKDALGQAAVVLAAGIATGMVAVLVLGALAGTALPFLLSPLTTVVPAAAMAVLGLAGAAVALRTVTSADPLTALGSAQ